MATNQFKESIIDVVNRSEKNRNLTREFLLNAFKIHNNDNQLSDGLNRYYQVQINSLINFNQEDIRPFLKSATNNTRCIKCGNYRKIKIRSRRSKNKSWSRKYCRYLRSLCDFICDTCHHSNTFKLRGRKALKNTSRTAPTLKSNAAKQPVSTSTTKQPDHCKIIVKRNPVKRSKVIVAPHQKQTAVAKPKQPPTFSSRLRAFSCLLKE